MRALWSGIGTDLRFALRQAVRHPGLSIGAALAVALGVGASSAVFSVMWEVLLKPLPYPSAQRLVSIGTTFPKLPHSEVPRVSTIDYVMLRQHHEMFSETGVFYFNDLTLTGAGDARHVDAVDASASLFRVLAVTPMIGRPMTQDDDRYGAPRVTLLSYGLWETAFGGDRSVIGRNIELNAQPYTIIGVMPPEFQFPYPATQLWIPMALRPEALSAKGRVDKWLGMVGRLAPGVSLQQARAGANTVKSEIDNALPAFFRERNEWHFVVRKLADEQTQRIRPWLMLAFGAVLCVFLISCSNVGGLLLISFTARRGELAVRSALGAFAYRIARQVLTETGLLVGAGSALGVLLAAWCVTFSNHYGPVTSNAHVGWWTIVFAALMAGISTLCAAVVSAMVSADAAPDQMLKTSAARAVAPGLRWRYPLLAGQIALAVVLLFTGAVLARSFIKLTEVQPGFSVRNVWTGAIALASDRYRDSYARVQFFDALQQAVTQAPDVVSVSACASPPFNPSGMWSANIVIAGRAESGRQAKAQLAGVLPGYFQTMEIPVHRGRTFDKYDGPKTERVAVVDEDFARTYFPGEDAIGKLVGVGGEADRPSRIIGIVGNVENSQLGGPHEPQLYWNVKQDPASMMDLVVRTAGKADITAEVRRRIAQLDPSVALFDVATMQQRIAESIKVRRFVALLLNMFAAVGLALAAVGLYASLGHIVELRRREIGIRVALGAVWTDVFRTVVAKGAAAAFAGVAAGIVGAVAAAALIRHQLFGIAAGDLLSWSIVAGALAGTGIVAAWIPTRRAMRVEAVETLREQ